MFKDLDGRHRLGIPATLAPVSGSRASSGGSASAPSPREPAEYGAMPRREHHSMTTLRRRGAQLRAVGLIAALTGIAQTPLLAQESPVLAPREIAARARESV